MQDWQLATFSLCFSVSKLSHIFLFDVSQQMSLIKLYFRATKAESEKKKYMTFS